MPDDTETILLRITTESDKGLLAQIIQAAQERLRMLEPLGLSIRETPKAKSPKETKAMVLRELAVVLRARGVVPRLDLDNVEEVDIETLLNIASIIAQHGTHTAESRGLVLKFSVSETFAYYTSMGKDFPYSASFYTSQFRYIPKQIGHAFPGYLEGGAALLPLLMSQP